MAGHTIAARHPRWEISAGSAMTSPVNTSLTREQLQQHLSYDSETGVFRWKTGYRNGKIAGCQKREYRVLRLLGRMYFEHRLAWLYIHGEWPVGIVDHIDGNGSNNSIANIREATPLENMRNRKFRGTFYKDGKYQARIFAEGKRISLGYFHLEEEAHAAYRSATEKYFGDFSAVNSREENHERA